MSFIVDINFYSHLYTCLSICVWTSSLLKQCKTCIQNMFDIDFFMAANVNANLLCLKSSELSLLPSGVVSVVKLELENIKLEVWS